MCMGVSCCGTVFSEKNILGEYDDTLKFRIRIRLFSTFRHFHGRFKISILDWWFSGQYYFSHIIYFNKLYKIWFLLIYRVLIIHIWWQYWNFREYLYIKSKNFKTRKRIEKDIDLKSYITGWLLISDKIQSQLKTVTFKMVE